MAEYIDREAAIKRLKQLHFGCKDFHLCGGVLLELNAIEAIPTADVKPVVRGKWIGEADGYADGELVYDTWYCSFCDYAVDDDEKPSWNFCPNCGADMRERNNG